MDDVAADVAQRCFEHVENEVRREFVRRLGIGISRLAGFRMIHAPEVFDHALRRAVIGELAAFIEQQGLVEHLQQPRAGLVDGGDDDLVTCQTADDFQHMLAVLGRQTGGRLIEEIHVGDADHVESGIEPLTLAAAEELLLRRASKAVTQVGQAEFCEFGIHALAPLLGFQMRAAYRHGEVEVFLHLEQGIKGILLRDIGDVGSEIVEVVIQREAVHQHLATFGFELSAKNAQQSALAAATGAHDADHLATAGDEAHAVLRGVAAVKAVAEFAHLDLAYGVALFFDDAVSKVAAQVLAFSERDGIAVIERDAVTHRNDADVKRARGAQHFEHAGLLRVIAFNAQQDLTIGVFREQDVAFVQQLGFVGYEVGVAAAFQPELPAKLLRTHAEIAQRDFHFTMSDEAVLDASLHHGAAAEHHAIERGLGGTQCLHRDAQAKAEPQVRSTRALRGDFGTATLREREVDLRA